MSICWATNTLLSTSADVSSEFQSPCGQRCVIGVLSGCEDTEFE